jgi:very-short-patch-repair endonuclease
MRGQSARNSIWKLIEEQHGVISRRQLLGHGVSRKAIERRIAIGRLHPLWRGIYAVGRPRVTLRGWWMGAVLACRTSAVLSHESAAQLWGIRETKPGNEGEQGRPWVIEVTVPSRKSHRLHGIKVHRRDLVASDRVEQEAIPVTPPSRTLIDLATSLRRDQLEECVNRADKLDLVDPESLRRQVDENRGMNGVASLRQVLDRRTFTLTDSELERRFFRLVRRAGLPIPKSQQWVSGFRVDFFWPELGLIVETDGLRYHRTPSQQAKDRARDQALVAAGFIVLRFTHAQVTYEPDQVVKTLRKVANGFRAVSPV